MVLPEVEPAAAALVMTTAVSTKLARVVLLAPVTLWVGARASRSPGRSGDTKRPPLVPLFVLVFLAAAMFALGCAVRVQALLRLGMRPVALATVSTVLAAATSLVGVLAAS